MAESNELHNRVRTRRLERGWSQLELAERAGISRTAVSAIEGNRLVPSVAAALSLARAFRCTVEELFGLPGESQNSPLWAWQPSQFPSRFWQAQVGDRTLRYPVEATGHGVIPHDGMIHRQKIEETCEISAPETLVMACCDPAVGLLVQHFAASTGFRLLAFSRSSQQSLDLLKQGLVHVAGLHLATADRPQRNREIVKEQLGDGYQLVRVARWQEGVALSSSLVIRTVEAALRSKLHWIGREPGSGARQCLDQLFSGRQPLPRRLAYDHRGVAEAIKCGWADAGVCVRLTSEEAGLPFLTVREEAYDLCFSMEAEQDPRIQALVGVLRSSSYRRLLGELPGYNSMDTGAMQ